MDEQEELKTLQKAWRDVARPFERLAKIKPTGAEWVSKVGAASKDLPPTDLVATALGDLRTKLEQLLHRTTKARREKFGMLQAEFIRNKRNEKVAIKEVANGWRVGMLELQFRPEQSQARALYNHEEIVKWSGFASALDIEAITKKANDLLLRGELEADLRVDVLGRAYESARMDREQKRATNPAVVPILDFYRATRIELVRQELAGKSPDRPLQFGEFPRWRFLFNLDRYRAQGNVGSEKRLVLQTGSQAEQQKGMGLVTNGLNAVEDYKVFCFVTKPK